MIADRSVSWKLRATIDYSEHNLDKSFMNSERAEEMLSGGGVSRKHGESGPSAKPITEDD